MTLLLFYLSTIAISWSAWTPLVLGRLGHGEAAPAVLHLLGSLGPALSALLISRLPFSPVRPSDLRRRLSLRATPPKATAAAILLPAVIGVAGLFGQWLAGAESPAWARVLTTVEYPSLGPAGWILASIVFYGFGEEIGWRGLALPILNRRFDGLSAALLMSLPWALWHLPLLISSPTYTSLGAAGLAGWLFSLATGSVLLTLLLVMSGGSLIPVAIFHATLDLAMVNPAVSPLGVNIMGGLISVFGLLAAYGCSRVARGTPGVVAPL
ncbi:CPBP family intramembrane metalloprotease [Pseudomonas sp. ODNR1LW]|nr:CPBP family intramembrane metalloprotease [Pseudomonas sp. ODNR1LW]